LNIATAVVLKN